jgi:5'(3')-deoxyribonucleotidase
MLVLKCDIDGVLRDVCSEVLKILEFEYGKKYGLEDINCFYFDRVFGIEDVEGFFRKYAKEIFLDAKPYWENLEDLGMLSEKYKIVLVSAQFPGTEYLTDKWLEKYGVFDYVDDVIYTSEKEKVKGNIFVDDCVHNLERSRDDVRLCMARPWNICAQGKFPRIKRLKEVEGYAEF